MIEGCSQTVGYIDFQADTQSAGWLGMMVIEGCSQTVS
jgi:hypothetical protein